MKCDFCKHKFIYDGKYMCEISDVPISSMSGMQIEECPYFKSIHETEAKADAGKPQLTLVPRQILFDIAEVREYGTKKYGDSENWKRVDKQRYRDAAFRHFMAYLDDPQGNDKESGLPHLAHLACNIAFLCELENKESRNNETIDISNN